jgi:geranylgeranyl diphosphate synthase type II
MHSFEELTAIFKEKFEVKHFPSFPATLYEPGDYFLTLSGKRIRPVMCLMGNELFGDLHPDVFHLATAIELFHNFTLIHDDIMDRAPLRRGKQTVHAKYSEATALLSGDVMMVISYDYLNKITTGNLQTILHFFNRTAREVCEGQQLDMDFEQLDNVKLEEYIHMIELKTSVLLATSLRLGAILGGAGTGNQEHLYEFGKNLGIGFQVQDDYLDAFGDPGKFGKQVGGDILANKKTFLMIKALQVASDSQREKLKDLVHEEPATKVSGTLQLFRDCGVDEWAMELKEQYITKAFNHLEDIAVLSSRKEPLKNLARYLMQRDF